MDVLSAFFNQLHLSGNFFTGGRLNGILELDKPPGTTFIHILNEGNIHLVRRGMPDIDVVEPSILLCPITCQYKLKAMSLEGANIVSASFEFGERMGKTFPLGIDETIIFPLSQLEKRMPVIEAILSEFNSPESGQLKALNALFEYILVILIREAVRHEDINKGVLYAMLETPLKSALSAIHEQPEKNWGLDDLASLVNMSRTKFAVMFTSVVGVAPINYLTSWRIKLATEMLVKGLPINRIATSVGYSSQSAFARAFMRELGLTPKKWLLSHKQ